MALAAVVVGYVGYGWPGVALALTVVVFWLLLQFSRALRVMRAAAGRPVGQVPNAVMLQAQLHVGMTLAQVMKLTGSFGQSRAATLSSADAGSAKSELVNKLSAGADEVFAWRDDAGDEVVVELRGGKLSAWKLQRVASPPD